MADLIDRAALLANCHILEADYDDGIEPRRAYAISIESVRNAPTVDVVPVVRGEWVEKSYVHEYANETSEERRYVVCGSCGKQPPVGFGKVNFCHNCGADMRESEVKE